MNVVAKYRARISVLTGNRGAGERHEGCIRQRITQVLGVTNLIPSLPFGHLQRIDLELSIEAVLRAMCLVGNDDDVGTGRQHREAVFILPGHELLNGREHYPATRAIGQLFPQVSAGGNLNRLLAQQVLRQGEHPKQLTIQIITIGDHDDGGVLHLARLHHPCSKTGHSDALT